MIEKNLPNSPKAIGYFARCFRSYRSHNSSCCKRATSIASLVALRLGLIADTKAATSIGRVQITGHPFTYNLKKNIKLFKLHCSCH